MSEEQAAYDSRRRQFKDGKWEVYYVPNQRLAVVLTDEAADGKTVTSIPLTPQRARMMIALLHNMLTEAGEPSGVRPSGLQFDDWWVLDCSETGTDDRAIGFKPKKKS